MPAGTFLPVKKLFIYYNLQPSFKIKFFTVMERNDFLRQGAGDYLLLGPAEIPQQLLEAGAETFMVKMQDGLPVVYYREM
jgi:hypothetical protein